MVSACVCDLGGLYVDSSEVLFNIKEVRDRLVRVVSLYDLNSVIVKEVEDELRLLESLL